jgi:hypothetical protein
MGLESNRCCLFLSIRKKPLRDRVKVFSSSGGEISESCQPHSV